MGSHWSKGNSSEDYEELSLLLFLLLLLLLLLLLQKMIFSIGTTVKIAFYSTLIESIIGVILCALYVLFHFCTITVSCPGKGKLQQVAFVFYTTYLREKGGCNVTSGN